MFNNTAIDMVIGLVFIYLLYSLMATVILEIVARWFDMRPRMLLKSIAVMLDEVDRKPSTFKGFFVETANTIVSIFKPFKNRQQAQKFYDQPTIKFLTESSWSKRPSYITASTFSETLLRMLAGDNASLSGSPMVAISERIMNGKEFDKDTATHLRNLLAESNQDYDRFKEKLESWFNDTQDRVKGWYKKQTQLLLFIIGFILACSNNVDSIEIRKLLSENSTIREALVSNAIAFRNSGMYDDKPVATATTAEQQKYLEKVTNYTKNAGNLLGIQDPDECKCFCKRLPGWLITALMISVGAPFWFDLLNKVIQLRASGKKEGTGAAGTTDTVPPSQIKG
jgi:hypothetical protein